MSNGGVTDQAAVVAEAGRNNVVQMRTSRSEVEAGLHQSFEDFVRAQYWTLVKFLRRRNNTVDAEEIAQESIISLMRYRDKGRASDWQPLLYRIAINHSHKRARYEARRSGAPVEIESVADDGPSPEEQTEHVQRAERLQVAILALPPKCRRVYLLRHGYSLSHAQIARRCGISVKTVEKHLANAVLHLQRQAGFLRGEVS